MSWPNQQYGHYPMSPGQVPSAGVAPQGYVVCMVPVGCMPGMSGMQGMPQQMSHQQALGHQDSDGSSWGHGAWPMQGGGSQHQSMQPGRGDQGGGSMENNLPMGPGGQQGMHHQWGGQNQSFQQQAGGGWNTSAQPFEPSDRNSDNRMTRGRSGKVESAGENAPASTGAKYVPPHQRRQEQLQQQQLQQQQPQANLAVAPGRAVEPAQQQQQKRTGLRNGPVMNPRVGEIARPVVGSLNSAFVGDQQPEATGQPVQQRTHQVQNKVNAAWLNMHNAEKGSTIGVLNLESGRMARAAGQPTVSNSNSMAGRLNAEAVSEDPCVAKHPEVDQAYDVSSLSMANVTGLEERETREKVVENLQERSREAAPMQHVAPAPVVAPQKEKEQEEEKVLPFAVPGPSLAAATGRPERPEDKSTARADPPKWGPSAKSGSFKQEAKAPSGLTNKAPGAPPQVPAASQQAQTVPGDTPAPAAVPKKAWPSAPVRPTAQAAPEQAKAQPVPYKAPTPAQPYKAPQPQPAAVQQPQANVAEIGSSAVQKPKAPAEVAPKQTIVSAPPAAKSGVQAKWGAPKAKQPAVVPVEEKKVEAKPPDWGEMPSLSASVKSKGAKGNAKSPAPVPQETAKKTDDKKEEDEELEQKLANSKSAWGKAGEEQRKKAAEEKARKAKEAAEAKAREEEEAAKRAAEEPKAEEEKADEEVAQEEIKTEDANEEADAQEEEPVDEPEDEENVEEEKEEEEEEEVVEDEEAQPQAEVDADTQEVDVAKEEEVVAEEEEENEAEEADEADEQEEQEEEVEEEEKEEAEDKEASEEESVAEKEEETVETKQEEPEEPEEEESVDEWEKEEELEVKPTKAPEPEPAPATAPAPTLSSKPKWGAAPKVVAEQIPVAKKPVQKEEKAKEESKDADDWGDNFADDNEDDDPWGDNFDDEPKPAKQEKKQEVVEPAPASKAQTAEEKKKASDNDEWDGTEDEAAEEEKEDSAKQDEEEEVEDDATSQDEEDDTQTETQDETQDETEATSEGFGAGEDKFDRDEVSDKEEVKTKGDSADVFDEHSQWLKSLLSFRTFGSDAPEDFVYGSEKASDLKAAEPADRSMFGSNMAKGEERRDRDRDRRGDRGRGGRDRDRDRDRDREPPEKLTLDDLGKKTGQKAENAYKVLKSADLDRDKELKRAANSLLNKICPENIEVIAKRIKNEAQVESRDELCIVIELIFKKALAEPHYCETYARMVSMLNKEMPKFPNPEVGGKDLTFKSILLNVCQNEFERMPRNIDREMADGEDAEDLKFRIEKEKGKFLANMKFIGHLYLQEMLNGRIIASITQDLLGCGPDSAGQDPEEHVVECVCELLTCIGLKFEEANKQCVSTVCGRLMDLKNMKTKDGKGLLSKRIQFTIQDVTDMRKAGWQKKTFKATAKTKEEVRLQAEKEAEDIKKGKLVTGAETHRAGATTKDNASANDGSWTEARKGGRR